MRAIGLLVVILLGCAAPTSPSSATSRPRPRPAASPTVSYAPCAPGKESVKGVVRFAGKFRGPHGAVDKERLGACESHDPLKLARHERAVGPAGELANVFIVVNSGLGPERPKPQHEPVRMTQWCILFEPRVVALSPGQPLVVRNGDGKPHTVHVSSTLQPEFGRGQAHGISETRLEFPMPEIGVRLACDIHAWERAWVHVVDHPFFAVTGSDGGFEITGLPPGDYELLVWHERFLENPLISKVKVEAGKTSTLDFTFEAPSK